MSLNFPTSPVVGETHVDQGRVFVWTGTLWVLRAEDIPWATLPQALAGVSADTIVTPETMRAIVEDNNPGEYDLGAMTCRAWAIVNGFDGTFMGGENIASVALPAAGLIDAVFQTPLPSANYIVIGSSRQIALAVGPTAFAISPLNHAVDRVRVAVGGTGGSGSVGQLSASGPVGFGVFL
jgi:hypothetical protein